MLRKRNIQKAFQVGIKVIFGLILLVILFQDFLKIYCVPPIMKFLQAQIVVLMSIMYFTFVLCSILLVYIVWRIEKDEKKKASGISRYISQLICRDYYADGKSVNFYQAIKQSLNKFSRDSFDGDESKSDKLSRNHKKYFRGKKSFYKLNPHGRKPSGPQEIIADGVHSTYYKNGQPASEITYKNNQLNGLYKTYYEDGKLHQEKFYQNGKLHGLFRAFDEEGVLYFEINYKDGKQDGITNIYYKTGILQSRDTFQNGKRIHGETYSESGEFLCSYTAPG